MRPGYSPLSCAGKAQWAGRPRPLFGHGCALVPAVPLPMDDLDRVEPLAITGTTVGEGGANAADLAPPCLFAGVDEAAADEARADGTDFGFGGYGPHEAVDFCDPFGHGFDLSEGLR